MFLILKSATSEKWSDAYCLLGSLASPISSPEGMSRVATTSRLAREWKM